MTAPIIHARQLGKQYRLGAAGGYRTLRDAVVDTIKAPARWVGLRPRAAAPPLFSALSDVSFDVRPGETVGVIGRNGAGKSTMMKILARITEPTTGEVRLRGRVAALLEVGTGFHPELTGRENVFLSGAVLGMTRAEIRASFDEIVSFAELEQFIDTPVKRYSSGMYVRLAFAVAAHLRPEILIVDEVLAVGDSAFQKKCLGKMSDVATGGRTVLFVSHNMAAVTRLCRRAILLKKGRVEADGNVHTVVGAYLGAGSGESPVDIDYTGQARLPGSEHVRLLAARVSGSGMEGAVVDIRRAVAIEMDFEILSARYPLQPNVHVFNEEGACVFALNPSFMPEHRDQKTPGFYRASVELPGNYLSEGMYSVDLAISTFEPVIVHCHERGALSFQVHDPAEGDSARGTYAGPYPGAVRPALAWRIEPMNPPRLAALGASAKEGRG
jgi:lipopolysaccharide transport system ATP-binding protein